MLFTSTYTVSKIKVLTAGISPSNAECSVISLVSELQRVIVCKVYVPQIDCAQFGTSDGRLTICFSPTL